MPSLRCCCCQAPTPLPPPAPPLPPSTDCSWFPPPLVPPSPASTMTTSYHAPTIQLEFPHVTAKSIICSLFGIFLVALVLWCCKKKNNNNAGCDAGGGDERPAQPIDPELFEDALCGAAGALSCSGCG